MCVCVCVLGVATVLNQPDIGKYGTMFKTVPETTQDFANRMTCFKVPGMKGAEITAQGVLPDLSDYQVCIIANEREGPFA